MTYVILPFSSYSSNMLDPACPHPSPRISLDNNYVLLSYSGTVNAAAAAAGTSYSASQIWAVLSSSTWTLTLHV